LQELDKTDSLPRTERRLSRAVSFAPNARAHIEEPLNTGISLSNKLMNTFNQKVDEVKVEVNKEVEDFGAAVTDENK
jgi:hypothetical protein